MAIQFVRIEIVNRKTGANACCKGAYNARDKVKDELSGITYNFERRGDNVYHKILLPQGVDQKFKSTSVLMNGIEQIEKQKNSQLLKEILIALPDDKELSLQDRINITHEIIEEMEWIKNGLAVQVDIHKPHDGEKNWHAHLLLTTRRFSECGQFLAAKKARDLNPEFKSGKNGNFIIPEEDIIHERGKRIINAYFEKLGLENRVDEIGEISQEHIGPTRMRSILNQAIYRNEERKLANIEALKDGADVIARITKRASVFSKSDLTRVVKCIPDTARAQGLVEDALADKSLIELFDESGKSTGYYTTNDIREDEFKLLRLSNYVRDHKNILGTDNENINSNITERASKLIDEAKGSLSTEQHSALSHLLLDKSGIRIMRGRAGTGKSHVLGNLASISRSLGVNVIGLAPTHKAKLELAKCGYTKVDTIKGMLFKLYNDKYELPKNSLLVLDEAGMVGNDDCLELLRVAASYKCNVILAGDERQLSSVQRGGMFEVFAGSYGATSLLDIKRQDSSWGRAVAMAFSNGDVRAGVAILEEHNRILSSRDKIDSMEALLSDWSKSPEELANKLIIAVKNKDVDALNHGARQHLRAKNYLLGKEIAVGRQYYMEGDRILIKQTNKELGLTNGDLADITYVSREKFIIETAEGKEISFDPNKYNGFSHGYATTVFKAQGQSINDVFVLHDGFATIRNSYVALSRNIKELKLYVNSEATRSTEHLIKQLSCDPQASSSLNYYTKRDLEKRKLESDLNANKGFIARVAVGALDYGLKKITEITDKNLSKTEYYQYTKPELRQEKVEDVLDNMYLELEKEHESLMVDGYVQNQERRVVGSNSVVSRNVNPIAKSNMGSDGNHTHLSEINTTANKSRLSAKERFYANADYKRDINRNVDLKESWDREDEQLRHEVRFNVERIARDLLGEPNRKLSNRKTLRFGDSGKIALRISGEKMGVWHDFSSEKGGDMFSLVQEQKGCDFKEAAQYLRQVVGMEEGTRVHLRIVDEHRSSDYLAQQVKAKEEAEKEMLAKARLVSKLEARAKPIGNKSIAHRYLTEIRNIKCELSNDIKTAGVYQQSKDGISIDNDSNGQNINGNGRYLPAIIAFARDKEGKVTGGQQILLDRASGKKANVGIAKKSFGRIAGCFVDIGSVNAGDSSHQENEKLTIIAEGLETSLSVKQALTNDRDVGINIKVLCSLGISNIRNYEPVTGEKIIIAADNDGEASNTKATIDRAKVELESRGSFVEVATPAIEGDFNDLLVSGREPEIRNAFKGAINKHSAITLSNYIASCDNTQSAIKLDSVARENLAYIQKYNLPEKNIVEAYRKGEIEGAIELDQSRKILEFAANCYQQNKEALAEARGWGHQGLEIDVTKAMLGMDERDTNLYSKRIRDNHLEKYLEQNISGYSKQKGSAVNLSELKPIISAEQKFLKETYESLKSEIGNYSYAVHANLKAGEVASKQLGLLDKIFKTCDYISNECEEIEGVLFETLSSSNDLAHINTTLERKIESYKVYDKPMQLSKGRLKSETIDSALSAIKVEQDLLADLDGNTKYYNFDKELMAKVSLAHTQRENKDFDKLESIAKHALENGAETPDTLLKKLQVTGDLEVTYKILDQSIEATQINSQLAKLNKQINTCEKPPELLQTIADKQAFLVTLEQNVKYPEQHAELLELSKIAKELELKQVPAKLTGLVQQSLSYYSEKSVVRLLKKATNLEKTCDKLEASIHERRIDKHIQKLDKQKQEAKTPVEVMSIIEQKQKYLVGLHSSIKDPGLYNKELIRSIDEAYHNIHIGNIAKLDKLVTFLEKNSNEPWVLTTLKSPDNLGVGYQSLLIHYHAKCMSFIDKGLEILDKGKNVTLDNKQFECPTKFLDYLTKTRGNQYFPHKEVQNIKTKVIEKEKQRELTKDLGLEL